MERISVRKKNAAFILILLGALLDLAHSVSPNSLKNVTASEQLSLYRDSTEGRNIILTTSSGAPVYSDDRQVINQNIIFNQFFMDRFTRFTRERITERLVHAKGAGAFGYFQVTNDITNICGANVFSAVGKTTNVVCRFSSVFYERGGPDTPRDARGFACKFYTEDGNWDLLSLASEIFVLKDPIKFIDFTRVFKRNPQTNLLPDNNMRWDFIVQNPESIFVILGFYGDGGIPNGYRSLPGFAIHAFQVVNNKGDISFVKFSWRPELLIANLTTEEAEDIQSHDLDYATRDLYDAIANGNYPAWKLVIQVLSQKEVENANFDVFDTTKKWPSSVRRLEVGRLVLNRNPTNYFADIEQLAFNPINLVPGILGGVDTVFQARRMAYTDTQIHRLGRNFNNIEVNCPIKRPMNYIRDGSAPVRYNGDNAPNYFPNSFNGPVVSNKIKSLLYQPYVNPEPNNFGQTSEFYEALSDGERGRLVQNLVSSLEDVDKTLQRKVMKLLKRVNKDLERRVFRALRNK